MSRLGKGWDGWGSSPPTPEKMALASRLTAELARRRLSSRIKSVTLCPDGTPLFDLASGGLRVSVPCLTEELWVAAVTSHNCTITPTDRTDLGSLVDALAVIL